MTKEEDRIVEILKEMGEMSTSEIEREFTKKGESCPDGAVKHLMRLKAKGMVTSRIDREKKGWVWNIK